MLRRASKNGITIDYELKQTNRKSIECRVSAESVTVFAPLRLPVREADAFVLRQAEWIEKTRRQAQRPAAGLPADPARVYPITKGLISSMNSSHWSE